MTRIGKIKAIGFLYRPIKSGWSFYTSYPAHMHAQASITSKLNILQYFEISWFTHDLTKSVSFSIYIFRIASLLQTLIASACTNNKQQLSQNTGDFHIINQNLPSYKRCLQFSLT